MKWLITFLAGALLGAGSLFIYLNRLGQVPSAAPPVAASAPATAPATGGNPEKALVTTDLVEADLPLRPPQAELPLPEVLSAAPPAPPLSMPVEGIKASQLVDTFDQPRGKERHHEALDIMAPRGAKVMAVADGKIVKLFNSKPGGLTIYQFDPEERYAYYYAHLERYADGIKEGGMIKRGALIGYVGTTGNAAKDAPHLHFAVIELTPKKQWWTGTPLNPYPLLGDQLPTPPQRSAP